MPIITMPDGVQLDLGDNPSPETMAKVRTKFAALKAAKEKATSTPTTGSDTSVTTTPTTLPPGAPEPKQPSGWGPTVARVGGPILGGIVGGATAALAGPEAIPAGIMIGAGIGGGSGDIEAQREEIKAGERDYYNPERTAAEMVTNSLFAGIPMGNVMMPAVLKAGGMGVLSNTMINLSEGNFPSIGQNALAFLTAGGLQGVLHALPGMAEVRRSSIKELAGTDEAAAHVNAMTGPNAPTHGPDGQPLDIPRMVVDPYGRPMNPEDAFPTGPKAGQAEQPGDTAQAKESRKSIQLNKRQVELDSFMNTRRPGILEADPVVNPPPLNSKPPALDLFEEDGGVKALKRMAGIEDMPGDGKMEDVDKGFTNLYQKYFGRTKDRFRFLQRETGLPVYDDYDLMSQAHRKWQLSRNKLVEPAYDALKGTDVEDQSRLIQALADPSGDSDSNLSTSLRKKVTALRSVNDAALRPFGINSNDFWGELVPAIANGDTSIAQNEKYGPIIDAINEHKISPMDPNLGRVTSQLISSGTYEGTAGPIVKQILDKYSDPNLPASVREAVQFSAHAMTGVPDRVTNQLGEAITNSMAKLGWDVDGQAIAGRVVAAPYTSLLAGRVGPAIHNSLQTIQTAAGPMGPRWLASGYAQLLTDEGRRLVESSGVSADSLMSDLSKIGLEGRITRMFDKAVKLGLLPFGKAEFANRGAVYLGTRAKILNAAARSGDNLQKFLSLSGVSRYSPEEGAIISRLWRSGNLDDAADRGAQMMVDNTQFMYSDFEKPRALTGSGGKYLGAFGNWPLQYAQYFGRLAMSNQVTQASTFEWARDLTRFMAANAAVAGTFTGLGKFFGDQQALYHSLGWTFLSPMVYSGAPLMQTLTKAGAMGQSVLSGEPWLGKQKGYVTPAMADFFRSGAPNVLPGVPAAMDVYRASEEPTGREKLGRYFAMKRGSIPRQPSYGMKPFGGGGLPKL